MLWHFYCSPINVFVLLLSGYGWKFTIIFHARPHCSFWLWQLIPTDETQRQSSAISLCCILQDWQFILEWLYSSSKLKPYKWMVEIHEHKYLKQKSVQQVVPWISTKATLRVYAHPASAAAAVLRPALPVQLEYIWGFPKVDHLGRSARIVLEQNNFSKKNYLWQDLNSRP